MRRDLDHLARGRVRTAATDRQATRARLDATDEENRRLRAALVLVQRDRDAALAELASLRELVDSLPREGWRA
ncbi:hypothetical protein [Marinitenerispora sediminis]|nr:hypothetical protein [Marinitenerispora sediminis]